MAACNQIRRNRVQGDGDGRGRIIAWPRRRSVRGREAGARWRRHNVGRPDHQGLGASPQHTQDLQTHSRVNVGVLATDGMTTVTDLDCAQQVMCQRDVAGRGSRRRFDVRQPSRHLECSTSPC